MTTEQKRQLAESIHRHFQPTADQLGYQIAVDPSEIEESDGVYIVHAHPDRDPGRATPYYDALLAVEEHIKSDMNLDVMIVPSGIVPPQPQAN